MGSGAIACGWRCFSLLAFWSLRITDAKEGNTEKTLMILWISGWRAAYVEWVCGTIDHASQ
jgi:hypothetical protein